jgi:hypothetical protein
MKTRRLMIGPDDWIKRTVLDLKKIRCYLTVHAVDENDYVGGWVISFDSLGSRIKTVDLSIHLFQTTWNLSLSLVTPSKREMHERSRIRR